MNKKILTGIAAIMMLTLAGCGSDDYYEPKTTETTNITSVTRPAYIENAAENISEIELEAENKEIENKISLVFTKGESLDPQADYDVYDYEIQYFLETGAKPENKNEIITYFKNGSDKKLNTFDLTPDMITYEISKIWTPNETEGLIAYHFIELNDMNDLNNFLVSTYVSKWREKMETLSSEETRSPWPKFTNGKYADVGNDADIDKIAYQTDNSAFRPYSDIKKMVNIEDYRIVSVCISTNDKNDTKTTKTILDKVIIPVYMFKINGTWKVDMVLTMECYRFTNMGTIEELFVDEPVVETVEDTTETSETDET